MKKILIINGPNLNLLGTREPHVYGHLTLKDIENLCLAECKKDNTFIAFFQSNAEGDIITRIHQAKLDGITDIIINAGAYSHTSIAILDALISVEVNVYEVHLSNLYQREDFRHNSYIAKIAKGVICGFKEQGYIMAINYILDSK